MAADLLTMLAISERHPTLVSLIFLFSIPNPASGKNLVCPTGKMRLFSCHAAQYEHTTLNSTLCTGSCSARHNYLRGDGQPSLQGQMF